MDRLRSVSFDQSMKQPTVHDVYVDHIQETPSQISEITTDLSDPVYVHPVVLMSPPLNGSLRIRAGAGDFFFLKDMDRSDTICYRKGVDLVIEGRHGGRIVFEKMVNIIEDGISPGIMFSDSILTTAGEILAQTVPFEILASARAITYACDVEDEYIPSPIDTGIT